MTNAGLFDVLAIQGITFPSGNISSTAQFGFEMEDDHDTAFIKLLNVDFDDTEAYMSFALSIDSLTISAAQAKKLTGVNEGESLSVFCELFSDDLADNRHGGVDVRFFDETGALVGDPSTLLISDGDEGEWRQLSRRVIVPDGATRMNVYLHAGCDAAQTVSVWVAHLKITR